MERDQLRSDALVPLSATCPSSSTSAPLKVRFAGATRYDNGTVGDEKDVSYSRSGWRQSHPPALDPNSGKVI
jgi:hypothetical protein